MSADSKKDINDKLEDEKASDNNEDVAQQQEEGLVAAVTIYFK